MPKGNSFRCPDTVKARRGSTHLQVPLQPPPQVEHERVYVCPITTKQSGGPIAVDTADKRTRAYTDRLPNLGEGERIDPTGATTVSAVRSSNGRSRELARSNALKENSPPSMDFDRARILAFRDKNQKANPIRERSQTATLCRGKYNNRKRTNSRFTANGAIGTREMTVSGTVAKTRPHTTNASEKNISDASHAPRLRPGIPRLPKLVTDFAKPLQVRRACARGEVADPEKHPHRTSKFTEMFSP